MKKYIAIALVALSSFVACKSQYEVLLGGTDNDAKYDAAFDYFNKGKYTRAAELFESLSVGVSGQAREDTVLYYWGLSNYRNRDYYTAETNFNSFVESFPSSPFSQEARFLRIDCLYRQTLRYELDQMPTYKAITAIGEFLSDYPTDSHYEICQLMLTDLGGRLDRKAYEAAKLYYKMEYYRAAKVAFKNVLRDDADNIYREDILYYTALSSYKYALNSIPEKQKERYMEFVDDYYNFVGEYPGSKHRREVDGMYKKAQKYLGKEVVTEGEALPEETTQEES